MSRTVIAISLLLNFALTSAASAQQFRVFTEVTEPTADPRPGDKPRVVARSLTLFHAGKVFDYLPSPVGEVSVFEPAHRRFVLFNGPKMIATTVTFAEIERLLETARNETQNYARQLERRNDPGAQAIVEPLKFALDPQFSQQFDPVQQQLTLRSPRFSYSVECATPETQEASGAYLNYADWAARLNYVLHPNSLFPAPRLQLNEQLKSHGLLPVSVALDVRFDSRVRRNAAHKFGWDLLKDDRQHINHWEYLMRGEKLEWMTFREYQRALLKAPAQARIR